MTYEKIVEKLQKAYAKAAGWDIGGHKAIQVNVRGEGEGALYIEVSEGKFNVQPYEYYDNDATVIISSKVLIDILDGKEEPDASYEAQKYSIVGDVEVAKKILSLRTVSAAKKAVKKAADEVKKAAKKASDETKKVAKKATDETKKAAKKASEETKKTAKKVTKKATEETKKVTKKAAEETKKVTKKAAEETKKVTKKAAEETKKAAKTAVKATKEGVAAATKVVKEEKAKETKAKETVKAVEKKAEAEKPAAPAAEAPVVKPYKKPVAIKPADDKK